MIALRLSIRTTCLSVGTVSCCHENFFPIYLNKEMKAVPVMIAAGMYFGLSLLTYKKLVPQKRAEAE